MSFIIIHTSRLGWKIKEKSSSKLILKSSSKYSLLNPYSYSKAYKELNFLSGSITKLNNQINLSTTGLIFEGSLKSESDHAAFFEYAAVLFKYLRFESMQSEIKANIAVGMLTTTDKVPKGKIKADKITTMGVYAPWYNTLITWNNLRDADSKIYRSIKLPVSEEILLDAFNALREQEFDKAILFSAIAVESLLANHFDALYESELAKVKKNRFMRIIHDKEGVSKDPIFRVLVDRTDFKKLLNEVPLYLMKRSIYIENEKLYHNLIKLYTTRNKIVHWGAPLEENESKRLSLNGKGANLAFEIALDTFSWIGHKRYEILRTRKHIILK
jgi:hypothetical protein